MEEVKEEDEEPEKVVKKDKKKGKNKDDSRADTSKEESKDSKDPKNQKEEGEVKEVKENEGEKEEKKEPEMREADIEDRVTLVNPIGENYNVYVSHQAASRILRRDIITCLVKNVAEFKEVDADELANKAEDLNDDLENKWISSLTQNRESEFHVFDFDLN